MRVIFWRGRLRRARGTLRDLLFGRLFAKAPCTVYGCAPSCACFRAEPVVFASVFGRAAISCFLLFTCSSLAFLAAGKAFCGVDFVPAAR